MIKRIIKKIQKDKKEIDEILFFDKNEANYLKNKKKRKFEAKEIGSSSRQIKEITKKSKRRCYKREMWILQ